MPSAIINAIKRVRLWKLEGISGRLSGNFAGPMAGGIVGEGVRASTMMR
jgi:hypothetical protein